MATEIRFRRGTTAQHATFIGAAGEVTVDTDKKTVVVHDGVTPGGSPLVTGASNTPNDNSVSTAKIQDNAVTNAKMADNAINTAEIVNLAVTTAKVADNAITNTKLANMAQATVKGRASGAGIGVPTDLGVSDLFTILSVVFPARPQTASGVGQFVFVDTGAGNGYTLPAGGTWAWFTLSVNTSAGTTVNTRSGGGVAAGGTLVAAATPGETKLGFAWRIA